MIQVWICAVGLCGATVIGSALGFCFKNLPHKWNDTILGFCAGIMLASSTIGLILPAFEGTICQPFPESKVIYAYGFDGMTLFSGEIGFAQSMLKAFLPKCE